jgi:hypothetical protein
MQNAALNAAFELKALQYKITEAKSDAECASIMASFLDKRGFAVTRKTAVKPVPKEEPDNPFERNLDVSNSPDFVSFSSYTEMSKAGSGLDMRLLMDTKYFKEYVPQFIESLAKNAAYRIVDKKLYHVDTYYDSHTDSMNFEVSIPYFIKPVGWTTGMQGSYMGKRFEWRKVQLDSITGSVTVSKHHSVAGYNPINMKPNYLNTNWDTTALITGT